MAERVGETTAEARGVARTVWTGLANGDTGQAKGDPRMADKSVQVKGTFGTGGTCDIEGSNDGGTTWHTLTDQGGNDLSLTAADTKLIAENTQLVRPNISAGDGTTALEVHLIERG